MSFSVQTGKVENFTASASTGWYTVTFDTPFSDGVVPVISAQIQTRNGGDTPGLRLEDVSSTGFLVRMDELILSNATSSKLGDIGKFKGPGKHPNAETLGWIAVAL